MKKHTLALLLVLAAALAPASLRAQEPLSGFPEGETKPFHLELGAAWASFDTQAGLSVQNAQGIGAMLDFEQLFNLPANSATFSGTGWWKWGKKSYIELGWISFDRSGTRGLTEDITWGEYTIKANATVDASFKSREIYVGYRYDFWQDERVRVSGTIGFGLTKISGSLSASGQIVKPDGTVLSSVSDKEFSLSGPIPLIGFDVDAAVSPCVTATFTFRGIGINIDTISGNVISSYLGVKWYFHPNLGVSGGLSVDKQTLRHYDTGDYTARASFMQSGVKLYLIGSF